MIHESKSDIHWNTEPEIETTWNSANGKTKVLFKKPFVTNDWEDNSNLIAHFSEYKGRQDAFIAYALDQLHFPPGAEYNYEFTWEDERTLIIDPINSATG